MPSLVILVSDVLVLSCGQTDTHTHTHTHRITDATKYFTASTDINVSNNNNN